MSIFRYLAKEEYARELVEEGRVRLCTLATYHVIEDQGVRRDPSDGLLRYKPEGGVTINQQGRSYQTDQAFVSVVKLNDVYVYCMSNRLSAELAARFETPFCVEFLHPMALMGRIRRSVRMRSRLDHRNVHAGRVEYRALDKAPGADWALPERLAFIKPEHFAWQDEFRIVVGNKGALGVENVDVLLESEGTKHAIAYEDRDPLVLRLGNLSNFTHLHRL